MAVCLMLFGGCYVDAAPVMLNSYYLLCSFYL